MFILMLYLLSLPFGSERAAEEIQRRRKGSLSILILQHKSGHEKVEVIGSSKSVKFD